MWGLTPVVLTALVYPGIGQLVQRRWGAAALALAGFTVAAVWFAVGTVRVLFDYYRLAFDFEHAAPRPVDWREIVLRFVVAMAAYLACVIDAAIAGRRGALS